MPQDRSWMEYARDGRMQERSKVLHRPHIVHDLVQRIDKTFAEDKGMRLIVKGPPRVGKSYSLINLSRYLLASANYWVTIFIPDCEKWQTTDNCFDFLLQSVGVDPAYFRSLPNPSKPHAFWSLVKDIDALLSPHGKKWVFIFDRKNQSTFLLARVCTNQRTSEFLPFHSP